MLLAGLVHFQRLQPVVEADEGDFEALALLDRPCDRGAADPELAVLDARKLTKGAQLRDEGVLVLGRDVGAELEED
jgi:hypothetical protein